VETLEGARAAALARLGLHAPEGAEDIDPGVRADLDALVRLTAQVCDAPVAAVNLVDADRLWQAATAGVSPVVVPRAETLCDTTVRGRSVLHVPDLSGTPASPATPLWRAGAASCGCTPGRRC